MANTRGQFQVEFLKSVVAGGGQIAGARFSLQRSPVKRAEPLYWLTLEQHGVRSLQELPWTTELERFLLFDARRKMDTLADEVERFAAILLNNLATAESDTKKDFVHAVLVAVLRERAEYDLGALLDRTGAPSPSRESARYQDCVTFIQHSIDGLRNTAVAMLGYSPEQATTAMRDALGIVIDETFHISTADQLFPRRS
jgi:hypothetical protein